MIDKTEYARSLGLLLRSVYAYRSLDARALGVEDWLASAPRRASIVRTACQGYPLSPRAKQSVGVYTSQSYLAIFKD